MHIYQKCAYEINVILKELRLLIGMMHQKQKAIQDKVYNWMSEYIMGQ